MFQELQRRLGTIDSVLNEEEMDDRNTYDIQWRQFNPSLSYTPDELGRLFCRGIEALKKSGQVARYILLEVILKRDGEIHSRLYLRGFESRTEVHSALADAFLEKELKTVLSPPFELPREWPYQIVEGDTVYDKTIAREHGGLNLSISVIGGGKFKLEGGMINLGGDSFYFGRIPLQYQDKLKELLDQLIQKPAYRDFQHSFTSRTSFLDS